MDETTSSICPWCSAEIPADAAACPKCGALVVGAKTQELPGVTEVDPAAELPDEPVVPDTLNPVSWLSAGSEESTDQPGEDAAPDGATDAATKPPTPEVALEMKKMELEAEITNAGGDVMGGDGETIEVGPPSEEALAAFEAGLLDEHGPAGEEMAQEAKPWEDPELEARLAEWRAQNPE